MEIKLDLPRQDSPFSCCPKILLFIRQIPNTSNNIVLNAGFKVQLFLNDAHMLLLARKLKLKSDLP